jgi:hypothetical protein
VLKRSGFEMRPVDILLYKFMLKIIITKDSSMVFRAKREVKWEGLHKRYALATQKLGTIL